MIRRSKPLARSTKPIPRKRAKPRRGPMRDPEYLAFLRSEGKCEPCCILKFDRIPFRESRIEAAHGPVNGRGSKGPDNEAIPMCSMHHREQHQEGWKRFEARLSLFGFDRKREAATWYAAYLIWKEGSGSVWGEPHLDALPRKYGGDPC